MDNSLSLTKPLEKWSQDIENVLDRIRVNAYNMSEIHRKRFLHFKAFSNYFDIPVIIISAANTIISVGVKSFLSQETISFTNCILSAICGIIVSIKLYLSIQTQMELELTTSKDFYTLSVEIYKTITLCETNRGVDGIVFLNEKFKTYSVLVQKSSILIKQMNDVMVPDKIETLLNLQNEVNIASNLLSLTANTNDIENNV
jgi:hypothetical protein